MKFLPNSLPEVSDLVGNSTGADGLPMKKLRRCADKKVVEADTFDAKSTGDKIKAKIRSEKWSAAASLTDKPCTALGGDSVVTYLTLIIFKVICW